MFKSLRVNRRKQKAETEEYRKALEFLGVLIDSPYSLKQIELAAEKLASVTGLTVAQELGICAEQVENGRAFEDTALGAFLQIKASLKTNPRL